MNRSFITLCKQYSSSHLVRTYCSIKMEITQDANTVKVSVKQGVVVGLERYLPSGLKFNSFHGIPYAMPPLGKLRFRSPVPLERFDVAELDCCRERDVSHQRDPFLFEVVGSENCLFLNIFVPRSKRAKPLPVMVWIHGGGFWFGNGNSDYHFPAKLMEEDVIVVTLNYRLGALGFLYLPEEGINGNAGLKDQRLALQWVQDNIGNFNGDPNNVTIFGESAGAASVHLHTYAEHSNKLFHKAIAQSGTANMEWVFQLDPAYKTRRLAELLGYRRSTSNTSELLQFLQSDKVTPDGILAQNLQVLSPDERRRGLPLSFKPVIEAPNSPDKFLDVPIIQLLQEKGRLQQLPLLLGYNSGEGMVMLVNCARKLNDFDGDLARLVPRSLIADANDPSAQDVADKMRQFYLKGDKLSEAMFNPLTDIFTDYHFNFDLQLAAEMHVRYQPSSPLFFYRFNYVGGRNMYKRMFQFEHLHGACHGDELFYLFQMNADKTAESQEDAYMSKRICQMWANFAHTGNPSTEDCTWRPVQGLVKTDESKKFLLDYLAIERKCEMKQNPDGDRIDFWRNMFQTYKPDYCAKLTAKL